MEFKKKYESHNFRLSCTCPTGENNPLKYNFIWYIFTFLNMNGGFIDSELNLCCYAG